MKVKSEKLKIKSSEQDILKAQLARALADYDNLVKRVERDRETIEKVVSLRLIIKLLTVLDGIGMAQEHLQDAGLAISIGEFKKILAEEGLTEINPKVGDEFNPEDMEAIEVVPGEKDNIISEVSLKGYKYNDGSVVRHAKVKVTKK